MIAISEASGERLWTRNLASTQMPWIAGDTVYVVDLGGKLIALDRADGKVRWMTDLPASTRWSGPVLAGGKLWLVSGDGLLVGADARSGQVTSQFESRYTCLRHAGCGRRPHVYPGRQRFFDCSQLGLRKGASPPKGPMSFTVAIVGRPNVGKSTLFNRLAGKRLALVDDQPGLTRDRREAETMLGSCAVTLIDTAGLEPGDKGLTSRMRQQTEAAIAQADLVLFLIDARDGIVAADEMFAELVRESGKPVILAANKCEGRAAEPGVYEAYALGLGEPLPISAEHGIGIGELSEAIEQACRERGAGVQTAVEAVDEEAGRILCASPSSAGRMSASRPSSMHCSARTG